jgi:hypothetical protein
MMAREPDDLGDARSRDDNRKVRAVGERTKAENPEYAYLPRWVPTGNWRMSWFDLIVIICGVAILLMVLGMRLFGIIG